MTVDLKDILLTRQWFYDFLGKTFYLEPQLDELKEISETKIFEQFVDEHGNIESESIVLLSDFFKNFSRISTEEFTRLKEDYNKLFVGPGPLLAPPWESVYLSRERIIFDEHTLAVREFYKRWGVTAKGISKEPDDHIGFELEFMNILINKSINALEDDDINLLKEIMMAQKEFLEGHILLWIEEFSDKLYNNSVEIILKV